jgi:oligopeptidase A
MSNASFASANNSENPLLQTATLPIFSKIKPEHVLPALENILAEYDQTVEKITQQASLPTWQNLVQPLEILENKLEQVWAPISHLNSVKNSKPLRAVYEKAVVMLSEHSAKVGQNKPLYEAYLALETAPEYANYDVAQKKIITDAIRDFKLSGVGLSDEQKITYQKLVKELAELESKFSQNVLDSTDNWSYEITDKNQLEGIPEHAIQEAEKEAKKRKKAGYIFTLEFPSYYAVITYAKDRNLREIFYKAYSTRASDQGPHDKKYDNQKVIDRILQIRQALASLLDFDNYAAYSLSTKMAKNTNTVDRFLQDLIKKLKPFAKKDFENLENFAKQTGLESLAAWDISYYSEKCKEKNYAISQEKLRAYFPEDKVLKGLFHTVNKLYGIEVKEVFEFDTYHPDVRFFEVYDNQGELRGKFYLDLYARAQKRGGAWVSECKTRMKLAENKTQTPVMFVVTNFSPPIELDETLLTHDEVITLFHEFGHCLHFVLTKADYFSVAGGNGVEWDAIELPSQFLENWAWEWEVLSSMTTHYKTGESLPKAEFDKLIAAKNFLSGMFLTRQLEFAFFDYVIHTQNTDSVQMVLDRVREAVSVVPTPDFNRFQNGFSHIFSGGYSAGYYSYLWAEVLSSDAFEKFKEEGVFNPNTGRSFLENILEKGGSEHAMALYKNFRGREPKVEALLRQHGFPA